MLRKLLALAVMFVLAAGMLVACGSEEGEGKDSPAGQKKTTESGEPQKAAAKPIDTVRVAYKNTVEEETARVEFTSVTSRIPTGATAAGEPDEMQFRMTGEGVLDLSGQRSRMTLRMGPIGSFEIRQIGNTAAC